ncbi:hypothetical protein Tco_0553910 [Tanacetum coccineum]
MEILLESTSNSSTVDVPVMRICKHGESNTYVLEDLTLHAGNPVKEVQMMVLQPHSSRVRNQGLVAKAYEWDEEEVSSDDNEMVEVNVLMALADDENGVVGKESARNDEWVKISMRKVHTLLEMEDNDERKSFLDYVCVGLNFVEEQRNNLVIKHRDIVKELNTCKENLLELKQAKFECLTMQHVKSEILKENQNLRKELKELTEIIETWLNTDDTKVSIPNVERPWLSEVERANLPNHDNGRIRPFESHVNITNSLVTLSITNSSVTHYDLAKESSSVCSIPLPPLKKLADVEPLSGLKTIKSILKSCSTAKTDTLKGVIINEPTNSRAPAKGNKKVLVSKKCSPFAGKLKNVKTKDDISLSVVMKELNDLKLQISKNQSAYSKNNKP